LDCPHCGKAFHDSWQESDVQYNGLVDPHIKWKARSTICPTCKHSVFHLIKLNVVPGNPSRLEFIEDFRVYPINTFRKPTPAETPSEIREDYEEACRVLSTSHKASAALSRRCLQAILRGQGYTQRDLAQQIDALLNEPDPAKATPSALRQTVDAVRNFGNFSAHPITDQTTFKS
jgi:hypothetical protein